jgi:hypothetical protein
MASTGPDRVNAEAEAALALQPAMTRLAEMIMAELPEDTEFALIVRIPNDPEHRIVTATNQQEIVAGLAGRWAWTGKPPAT